MLLDLLILLRDLNNIFGLFNNKNINDLIIDLRYNGGGSVKNCVELASMITGQFKSEVFAEESTIYYPYQDIYQFFYYFYKL